MSIFHQLFFFITPIVEGNLEYFSTFSNTVCDSRKVRLLKILTTYQRWSVFITNFDGWSKNFITLEKKILIFIHFGGWNFLLLFQIVEQF